MRSHCGRTEKIECRQPTGARFTKVETGGACSRQATRRKNPSQEDDLSTLELDQDVVHHRDREGKKLTLMEWSRLFEDREYRVVAETKHGDALVRTLWEGLDDGVEVACQYHTGIHWGGEWTTVWEGYWPCTDAQAKAKHQQVVALLRETTVEHRAQLQLRLRAIERKAAEVVEQAAEELEQEPPAPSH
jgi:hypothetical protein